MQCRVSSSFLVRHVFSTSSYKTLIDMSKRKRKQKSKEEKKDGEGAPEHYEDLVKANQDFETYYKLQKICPEEEWDSFMNALRTNLPVSFRITGSKTEAKTLLKIVQGQYFKDVINAQLESDSFKEPVAVPWYPDNLAWQLQLSRKDVRSDPFSRLHTFLISETDSGYISRQELVSMIPPIALDVKSHHKILDMCAAPGSKTTQLIEYLHKDEERFPKGFVIANDVDNNRCYKLVHMAKRLNSPNIIITNHDAAIMPNFLIKENGSEEFLKFDRILCDVPCTGDGTLRKHPEIWSSWNSVKGASLHGVQFRILKRGMEMLAVGGRLVYSTCSFNPLENDAVIARFLIEAKGSVRLVNLSPCLPGLIHLKGLKTWLVTSRDMQVYRTFEEVPEKWHTVIRPQMFPPPPEVADELHLDWSIRILPHQQDTGGFFVAALEKVGPLPWEFGYNKPSEEDGGGKKPEVREPARKKRKIYGYKEDPFVFFKGDEPIWKEIKEFYDLADDLPVSCLLARSKEGKKNNLYLTSPQVRDIVINNEEKFKIINTGVKTFSRCFSKNMKCSFRLCQEGLWGIFPFIKEKRKIYLNKEDLLFLLSHHDMKSPPETTRLHPDTQKVISSIGSGCCVFVYEEQPKTDESLHLQLVGWVGTVTTRAYVSIKECVHFLRLLGGDTSKFETNKFKKGETVEQESKQNGADPIVEDIEEHTKN